MMDPSALQAVATVSGNWAEMGAVEMTISATAICLCVWAVAWAFIRIRTSAIEQMLSSHEDSIKRIQEAHEHGLRAAMEAYAAGLNSAMQEASASLESLVGVLESHIAKEAAAQERMAMNVAELIEKIGGKK